MSQAPFVLMVCGPNGSGKTTLTDQLRREGVDLGVYINADEIARDLSGDYNFRVRQAQEYEVEIRSMIEIERGATH